MHEAGDGGARGCRETEEIVNKGRDMRKGTNCKNR